MEKEKLKEVKKQSKAGRKSAILFDNDWNRALFDLAAKIMIEQYYDDSPENTKKKIVFPGPLRMGKTLFWACVHLICRRDNIINNGVINHNLEPFVEHLTEVFGEDVIGDRSTIQKNVQKLVKYEVNRFYKSKPYETEKYVKEVKKNEKKYHIVDKYWGDAVKQIKNACNQRE